MTKKFNWDLEALTKNQQKIADYIEKNVSRLPYLTELDMAEELKISIASVSRFWKVVGYKNLKDFKLSLIRSNPISPANKMQHTIDEVETEDLPGSMLERGIQYLRETGSELSRVDFHKAVEAVYQARRVYIFAPGPSEGLGNLLQFRLSRFGFAVHMMAKSGHELYEALMHLSERDTVVIFGFVNMLPETDVLLQHAKEAGYKTILITDCLVSEMNANADMVLYALRGQVWEFHSMVAPTMLVESLVIGVGMRSKESALGKLEKLNKLRKRYAAHIPK
ncbi:MurR/RpiR family transcriptional regulator [Paenibacillus alba]|uniref:MurR/RpiR family transcriptional regulator n=1 Tax=Paenibacillus alba TaxID=1197127 RepID=UPI001566D9EE|nr:MurR/RpiR family transcriptional regulator [Paenibacillus alba]NQX67489.1 MurR/RpiR family transcriptional regulator [Paenibacillus alba]